MATRINAEGRLETFTPKFNTTPPTKSPAPAAQAPAAPAPKPAVAPAPVKPPIVVVPKPAPIITPPPKRKMVYLVDEYLALNIPPPECVVDDMFVIGESSGLIAKQGVGKSALTRQLAVDVSKGWPFLGRKTLQGGVLLFKLEGNTQLACLELDHLGFRKGDPLKVLDYVEGTTPEKVLIKTLEESKAEGVNMKLVILDTLSTVFPVKDENDYGQTIARGQRINDIARQYGVHILLIRHSGKGGNVDPRDKGIGSTGTSTKVDMELLLTRNGPENTIETIKTRSTNPIMQTTLKWDKGTKRSTLVVETVDDSGLTISSAPTSKRESKYARCEREILEFLDKCPGSNTTAVKAAVRGDSTLILNILKSLEDRGQVTVEEAGGKGSGKCYRPLTDIPVDASVAA